MSKLVGGCGCSGTGNTNASNINTLIGGCGCSGGNNNVLKGCNRIINSNDHPYTMMGGGLYIENMNYVNPLTELKNNNQKILNREYDVYNNLFASMYNIQNMNGGCGCSGNSGNNLRERK
jgi:hypothetical protein